MAFLVELYNCKALIGLKEVTHNISKGKKSYKEITYYLACTSSLYNKYIYYSVL